jgi:hypothetical protein
MKTIYNIALLIGFTVLGLMIWGILAAIPTLLMLGLATVAIKLTMTSEQLIAIVMLPFIVGVTGWMAYGFLKDKRWWQ